MTNADSAVRSIRIAATLVDRFGAIVRESESATLSVIDPSQAEVRIGEAQQLYPEIWRHLDDARAELAKRGVATIPYDSIRGGERGQAITNIQTPSVGNVELMDLVSFKAATFNADGHKKAVAACDALMKAMPEVDWKKLAQEEAATIAAAGSLKPSIWSWLTS
jgi:hypothetical protein